MQWQWIVQGANQFVKSGQFTCAKGGAAPAPPGAPQGRAPGSTRAEEGHIIAGDVNADITGHHLRVVT